MQKGAKRDTKHCVAEPNQEARWVQRGKQGAAASSTATSTLPIAKMMTEHMPSKAHICWLSRLSLVNLLHSGATTTASCCTASGHATSTWEAAGHASGHTTLCTCTARFRYQLIG